MKTYLLVLFTFSGCFLPFSSLCKGIVDASPVLFSCNDNLTTVLKGKVIDEHTLEPLVYASVVVFSLPDSVFVQGVVTDSLGHFNIEIKQGLFYVVIDFLSYDKRSINVSLEKNQTLDLGNIPLKMNEQMLAEVTVKGQAAYSNLGLDKKQYLVTKDFAGVGGTALQLLERIGGVYVDSEGKVTMRGTENIQILVDGKIIASSTNNGNLLSQFPSDLIEKIEVITAPSANYDSQGAGGIINLVLKRGKQQGLNAAFSTTLGLPKNVGFSYNMNYGLKSANIFSNFSAYSTKYIGNTQQNQTYDNADAAFAYFCSKGKTEKDVPSASFLLGVDWNISPKNTLMTSFLIKRSHQNQFTNLTFQDFDDLGRFLSNTKRLTNLDGRALGTDARIRYVQSLKDDTKSKWSIDAQHIRNQNNDLGSYRSSQQDTFLSLEKSNTTELEENFLLQTDLVLLLPQKKAHQIETGLKTNFRNIQNEYLVEELKDYEFVPIPYLNDKFTYSENVYAAYFSYVANEKNFSYKIGIRTEYADIELQARNSHINNPRKRKLDFFPNLHASFKTGKCSQTYLNYGARLSRPRIYHLQPFTTFADNRNVVSGNPELSPEYTKNYELGHLLKHDTYTISSSVYYRHATNEIMRILSVNKDGTSAWFPINMGTQDIYGTEISANYDPNSWIQLHTNFNIFRAVSTGDYEGNHYSSNTISYTTRTSVRFNIKQIFNLQSSIFYRAPINTIQGKQLALHTLDVALSKNLFKDKATLILGVRDLLNGNKRRHTYKLDDYYSDSEIQKQVRQLYLVFSYRINRADKKEHELDRHQQNTEEGF